MTATHATAPPMAHRSSWRGSVLAPTAAGLATVCASSALTGVVGGIAWLGYVVVATALVAYTGLALRVLRAPTIAVGVAQLGVLAMLVTGVFTSHGILGVIPGPAAVSELRDVLIASAEQIRTGLAPVEATPPILCLVTIAIGLVAVLVDTLAVAASAPAATGLVLLCVYAVPASLDDTLLPWWTFVLGAAAFAGLLAVDGNHRHRTWRTRDAPGLSTSPSSASTPAAVVSVAVVCGLLLGSAITPVGTVGRLPGTAGSGSGATSGGLGVNPFTSLRGMLDQGNNTELFRVRGLGNDKHLLRAFTLDSYRSNEGWALTQPMPAGVPAVRPLPPAPGDDGMGPTRQIQIEPVNWVDVWLPVYGAPRALTGIGDHWYYDQVSGAVFTQQKERPSPYTEWASLDEPGKAQLRAANSHPERLPPSFSQVNGLNPRVYALARQLTENQTNNFDKATALWQFFTAQNGFVYDTRTAPATDADALADFLFNGKRGYCEQFASSMAVMLRALNIPARVAVGFTAGFPVGDYRAITSQDAHAWVEVYFGDLGWVSFDPTPLANGRGFIPPYLQPDNAPQGGNANERGEEIPGGPGQQETPAVLSPAPAPNAGPNEQPGGGGADAPDSAGWIAAVLAVLAAALTIAVFLLNRRRRAAIDGMAGRPPSALVGTWLPAAAAALWLAAIGFGIWLVSGWLALVLLPILAAAIAPSIIREIARRRRLRTIAASGSGAADAAWRELLDECADRGVPVPESETVRATAKRVAQQHHLDEEGRDGLRTVVGVVERSWYGRDETAQPTLPSAFERVRDSLHRNAPMSLRGRLFPRSLFRRAKN